MPAIEIHNLSKCFRLYTSKTESAVERFLMMKRSRYEKLWALDGVNLEVNQGRVVGVIGPNGSGKSTLLKVLSRIYRPDGGTYKVNGNVAALLELGAGFHPELTGRENIFLNGSILGLTRKEMKAKFNTIVEFSGLEKFLDTPIKNYSSGMVVRLGFSVAMSIDPEVLLIDEVLGVGDLNFSKKSFMAIKSFAEKGRTILFVSHDLSVVGSFADEVVWLDEGKVRGQGDPTEIIKAYMHDLQIRREDMHSKGRMQDAMQKEKSGSGEMTIEKVRFYDPKGEEKYLFTAGEDMDVVVEYAANKPVKSHSLYLAFHAFDGRMLIGPILRPYDAPVEGSGRIKITFPALPLLKGEHFLSVGLFHDDWVNAYDFHDKYYRFTVNQPTEWGIKGEIYAKADIEYQNR
ncbi:MAG: ABC transporter ATP-binding protein [bacterium]|nr:ABC transporter ATP-binding protein [bacterium]